MYALLKFVLLYNINRTRKAHESLRRKEINNTKFLLLRENSTSPTIQAKIRPTPLPLHLGYFRCGFSGSGPETGEGDGDRDRVCPPQQGAQGGAKVLQLKAEFRLNPDLPLYFTSAQQLLSRRGTMHGQLQLLEARLQQRQARARPGAPPGRVSSHQHVHR